mmetsp:Transcript_2875/g.8933  ORF Transcript_2875/g.8933 Transcript_2875/m.8933 type:complete len:391 (-) Transcript_2875:200-1372(-)
MTTLPADEANIQVAAERLAKGLLVAMPTETVYGLGADALNEAAAKRIFEVKGRPPTDPLIVHITDLGLMDTLWEVDADTRTTARAVAGALWPGPITLVARAADIVPTAVTGGSGFVGLRSPNHPVARALIDASGKCIAAPSANTFGHVSPTTAAHVAVDLAPRDKTLTILDAGACTVGVESTVVRMNSAKHLEILRRGAVSAADIIKALNGAGLDDVAITIRDTRSKYASEAAPMDGPGQLLTHYSPNVPSFLVAPNALPPKSPTSWAVDMTTAAGPSAAPVPMEKTVVIDFGSTLADTQFSCLAYRSLSSSGSAQEACQQVFDALRWTETVDGAAAVIFPLVSEFHNAADAAAAALLDAVEDRLFRAASGRVANFVVAGAANGDKSTAS